MADELTAVFGGLLAYVGVLAALGMGVIYLLDLDQVSAEATGPRAALIAMDWPQHTSAVGGEAITEQFRPELRRGVTPK